MDEEEEEVSLMDGGVRDNEWRQGGKAKWWRRKQWREETNCGGIEGDKEEEVTSTKG